MQQGQSSDDDVPVAVQGGGEGAVLANATVFCLVGPDFEFVVAVLAQQPREFGHGPGCGRDLLQAAHDRVSLPTATASSRA